MDELTEIDRLFAHQHGAVSRRQALRAGVSPTQVHARVSSGKWILLAPAVYATASSPPTWKRHLRAALLSQSPSLAAGRSAAFLHGLEGFRRTKPEILVPFTANARSSLARIIRSRHFDAVMTTTLDGFEATTVAETILTLALREHPATIERALDQGLATGKLRVEDFAPILERLEFARQRGLAPLRRMVAERRSDAYQPPTTELERLLYRMLDRDELPAYVRQLPNLYETVAATVDAYVPAWRMVVEGDGRSWHTRKADFERDRLRDNAAAEAGLVVVRFTYSMLKKDPAGCAATLLRAGQWRRSA